MLDGIVVGYVDGTEVCEGLNDMVEDGQMVDGVFVGGASGVKVRSIVGMILGEDDG